MRQSQQFHAVRRPKNVSSPYALVVADGSGIPHLPLTVFYHELQRFLPEGPAKTYLATLLLYFDCLHPCSWRRDRAHREDSAPVEFPVRVQDIQIEHVQCIV